MSIDVEQLDPDDAQRWNDLVKRSPHGSPFHLYEALETFVEYTGFNLHPFVGYKGQEPVGLFPLFEKSKGPFTAIFSPPPDLKIIYQGPILVNTANLKQRKAERRNRRFIEGCLSWVRDRLNPKYTLVRSTDRYTDARPFYWNDFDITPLYSYIIDLTTGSEDLLTEFSRDARKNVTKDYDRVDIYEGDANEASRIITQVRNRHEEQGESYKLPPPLMADLYDRMPGGTVRPYTCTVDGDFAGGMVALELNDTIYRWQGGTKTDKDVPVNDLVDWRIIRDGIDRGLDRYDLVGAFTPRLCEYKAKFAPELVTYYEIKDGSATTNLAVEVYKRFR